MPSKREYFNELAARWDQIPALEDAPRKVQRFVEQAGVAEARRILDVGCGTGVLLAGIPETAWVVEVDFAERMLQENTCKFASARVERVCADAGWLPFRGGCFDLALCFGVLPHLADQEAALAGVLAVLRSGGALCVGHLVGSQELNAFHGSLDGPIVHDRLPRAAELAEMLERLGAAVTHQEEDSDWYFVRAKWPGC